MANKERGEVDLSVDGKTYSLRIGINALCEMEDHFKMGFVELMAHLQKPENYRISTVRSVAWFALKDANDGITEDIFKQILGVATFGEINAAVTEALNRTFAGLTGGGDENQDGDEKKPRPRRRAKAGTGSNS